MEQSLSDGEESPSLMETRSIAMWTKLNEEWVSA